VKSLVLGLKNILRNKLRTVLTVSGVAVAIVAFLLLRTVLDAWTAAVDHAAKDRIGTRNKVSFVMPLPLRYMQEIREIPGVKAVSHAQWFGAKDPKHEDEFFGNFAVVPEDFLEVYDEISVPPDQKEGWFQNRKGALVGDALAKKLGWEVGDRVTLRGTIYAGDWEFEISAIYTALRRSIDRYSFVFHYDYLNEAMPPGRKDQIGWVVSRIDDPGRAAAIAQAVDRRFEERDIQTLSMSERALNTSFLGMISAVLEAVNVVSVVILIIMMLILGNTIAMGVRERTNEYGVLRAIGFLPRHIAGFVLGEAFAIGALGGIVGLLIGYPFVEKGLGRFLEENMGAFFPFVRISATTAGAALALSLLLALAAALIPAYRASKLDVVDALRRIG
jgi:putative ABC transport system permease protein